MERATADLVHLAYTRNLLAGARARGADVGALLAEVGLPADPGELPPRGLPVPVYIHLARTVVRALDDELMGLLDRPIRLGTFELMAAHASHAGTLRGALERLTTFSNVLDHGLRYEVAARGDAVAFVVHRRRGRPVRNELAIETALVLAHRFIGWLGGVRLPIDLVELDYSRPSHARTYATLFFRAPARFEAQVNRMVLPAPVLDRAVRRTEEQAMRWARRSPLDAFLPMEAVEGLALRAASVAEKALRRTGQAPSMEEVAARLRMAPHQLRRRLKEEGADYRHIRNEVKRDAAIRLLTTTDLSVEQVALRSGFSAASAFVRAFRRWTGLTPRAYRLGPSPD